MTKSKCTCEECKLLRSKDKWKEFEDKFGEMLNHIEVCLGVSERENLKLFILTQIEKAREEGIKIGLKQAVSAMENVLNNQKP